MLRASIFFALCAVALGALVFWVWRERERAREQARRNAELAELGQLARSIGHDLDGLFGIVLGSLSVADSLDRAEILESLRDVERAAGSARAMVRTLRGRAGTPDHPLSIEGVVRLVVALVRRSGVKVSLRIDGDLACAGSEVDALRLVQNLVVNAAREARECGGSVAVMLAQGRLAVRNPVRAADRLSARIYDAGVSGEGSTGLGLAIAVEAAGKLGWSLRHEVEAGEVTFFVEPLRKKDAG